MGSLNDASEATRLLGTSFLGYFYWGGQPKDSNFYLFTNVPAIKKVLKAT